MAKDDFRLKVYEMYRKAKEDRRPKPKNKVPDPSPIVNDKGLRSSCYIGEFNGEEIKFPTEEEFLEYKEEFLSC